MPSFDPGIGAACIVSRSLYNGTCVRPQGLSSSTLCLRCSLVNRAPTVLKVRLRCALSSLNNRWEEVMRRKVYVFSFFPDHPPCSPTVCANNSDVAQLRTAAFEKRSVAESRKSEGDDI